MAIRAGFGLVNNAECRSTGEMKGEGSMTSEGVRDLVGLRNSHVALG